MAKPPERILSRDAGQRLDDRILKCFACASADSPQEGLQFGKGSLNWREIGRVPRQKQELAASRFDSLPAYAR